MSVTHIKDLKPDTRNARKHNPRNIGMLVDSLQEVGAARSIVIDEDNNILAGNGTIDAAAEAGIEKVKVVEADGETIIAVRRTGLTAKQKKRLALLDNRTAELAEWDAEVLAKLAQEDVKLDDLWAKDELDVLLAQLEQPVEPGAGGDEFDTTPDDGPTRCQPGDLWKVGVHRLLCGDCTKREDVERVMDGEKAGLMITDPPYAVAYVDKARDMNRRGYGHSRAKSRAAIQGDEIDEEGAEELWRDSFTLAQEVAFNDQCAIYAWHASNRAMRTFLNVLDDLGWLHHQTLIWDKGHFVIGRCDYQARHESCWYGWVKGNRPPFYGPKNQTTMWDFSRDTITPEHPTQKPLAIFTPPMTNHLLAGELAFDPFIGSGTTLIAAHRTGRRCYGIEIEPRYCDVILKRAEAEGIGPLELMAHGTTQ